MTLFTSTVHEMKARIWGKLKTKFSVKIEERRLQEDSQPN
jgi:hypothetical protein